MGKKVVYIYNGIEERIPCHVCDHDYWGECKFGALKNVLSKTQYGSDSHCTKFECTNETFRIEER